MLYAITLYRFVYMHESLNLKFDPSKLNLYPLDGKGNAKVISLEKY